MKRGTRPCLTLVSGRLRSGGTRFVPGTAQETQVIEVLFRSLGHFGAGGRTVVFGHRAYGKGLFRGRVVEKKLCSSGK